MSSLLLLFYFHLYFYFIHTDIGIDIMVTYIHVYCPGDQVKVYPEAIDSVVCKYPLPPLFPLLFFISPTLLFFLPIPHPSSFCTPSLPSPTFHLTFHLLGFLFIIYPPPSAHRSRGNLVPIGK